ncbi:DUF6544 family protein [Cucumibacter marinus]|uniref:DUF6544 family protein n=1 Tax=Cucumibacter marinus TaxID=1121252 RepID=UPI0004298A43|nr:DUF6544 family protein [Cucumibacter marinus]
MFKIILVILFVLGAAVFAGFAYVYVLRSGDDAQAQAAREQLLASAETPAGTYSPELVAALPEAAQRYFAFSITPGSQIRTVASFEMGGEFGMGNAEQGSYLPMNADQVLALPHGLIWRAKAGEGLMRMSGSDGTASGEHWTKFWLFGVIPVVRAEGGKDLARSAFGRMAAEAAIWTPAALLPGEGIEWVEAGPDLARAVISADGLSQTVDIALDNAGRPQSVSMMRWNNANPEGVWQEQPFGGTLDDFREIDGYRVAFAVDAGNFFGTPDFFPFFKARLTAFRFE